MTLRRRQPIPLGSFLEVLRYPLASVVHHPHAELGIHIATNRKRSPFMPSGGIVTLLQRSKALIARDVRFVLIAGIGTVVVGTSTPWKEVFGWFKIFMS